MHAFLSVSGVSGLQDDYECGSGVYARDGHIVASIVGRQRIEEPNIQGGVSLQPWGIRHTRVSVPRVGAGLYGNLRCLALGFAPVCVGGHGWQRPGDSLPRLYTPRCTFSKAHVPQWRDSPLVVPYGGQTLQVCSKQPAATPQSAEGPAGSPRHVDKPSCAL